LCSTRRSEPALMQGELVWLDNEAPAAVLSYLRTAGNEKLLTVINLTDKPVSAKLVGVGETFKALLAEGAEIVTPDRFLLQAHGYFVGKKSD
jgi:hypothetical protein